MDIDERKKVVKGISITAILGVIATVVGILANVHELGWFEKEETPSTITQDYAQSVVVDDNSEENVIVQEEVVEEEVIPPMPEPSKVKLCDMKVVESEHYNSTVSNAEDTIGNNYSGNVTGFSSNYSTNGYAIYYLGGKYKTLTGTIAVSDRSFEDATSTLSISGDENLLYTTEELSRLYVPIEFSINIEGIQWLRIDNSYCLVGSILYNWTFE